ncbi:MAG: hypothetical protein ACR2GX_06065 [Candidatus Dormibacteria bacterium]
MAPPVNWHDHADLIESLELARLAAESARGEEPARATAQALASLALSQAVAAGAVRAGQRETEWAPERAARGSADAEASS